VDPYCLLDIAPDATSGQITAAHRRAAMSSHPDRGGSTAEFIRVQRAFEVLSDPHRRAFYDRWGVVELIDLTDAGADRDGRGGPPTGWAGQPGASTGRRRQRQRHQRHHRRLAGRPWLARLSPLAVALPLGGAVIFYLPALSLGPAARYLIFVAALVAAVTARRLSRQA
jgi:curved DNA-binding protein CbpA